MGALSVIDTNSTATPCQAIALAVDWGTSSFRMMAVSASSEILASFQSESGASTLAKEQFAPYLHTVIKAQFGSVAALPLILSGMVGSGIGWVEVPYLACPATPDALARALHTIDSDGLQATIVPGLRCQNSAGGPDFMRGEETQVVGWLASTEAANHRRATLCLPGTHSKWVCIEDGQIRHFSTALTGELFSCLRAHSILIKGKQRTDDTAFCRGVNDSRRGLSSQLFATRALVLAGDLPPASAQSYLSGLLIGAELREKGAEHTSTDPIHVIGSSSLCALYQRALGILGTSCQTHDGARLAAVGLAALATHTTNSTLQADTAALARISP
ncbi:2-dehydro-3-deoxygalactonokinase [Microbulbifer salipaludis]|uniref:2-dehydro-3-deoxygalactonokinase n=1 Tax=Microbulbifer salipaludis TaxID=187980 RepID=A0ABS3E7M5_9GAMM|nr:2-dehydro-3-deoxygalactonokinase [Microbulbifer salipaludis]MBN8431289.1 2-dehydro-3-deoxygalactonokinase [Microbulbifer salipaludis]